MNDLFTNLVLRTLKPEEGLQPRLRTRFEPARLEPDLAPATSPHHSESHRSTRMDPGQTKPGELHRGTPPEGREPRSSPREKQLHDDDRHIPATHTTIRTTQPREPLEQSSRLNDLVRPDSGSTEPSRAQKQSGIPAIASALQPVNAVPQAVPALAHAETREERLDVNAHRSTQTVRVTIGRVEVRAVLQAGAKPGRTASASAVMTLDEYLTRRAKGGPS